MAQPNDYLMRHLQAVPAFRALLRSIEAQKMASFAFARPVLDLGCGDGNFAQMTFVEPLDAGIDPSPSAIEEARRTGIYREVKLIDGLTIPYPDNYFASVMSNSVLEHIPNLDATLSEVHRVLQPGGSFVFTTPSEHFAEHLFVPTLLRNVKLRQLATKYENYFNRISRHCRTDSAAVWLARLEHFGFHVRAWHSYFPALSSRLFDLLHYYSAPAILYKKVTGRWVIAPFAWNFVHLTPILRRHVLNPDCAEGAYLLFDCQRGEK
jgi:SAM-dependent methyltransferase